VLRDAALGCGDLLRVALLRGAMEVASGAIEARADALVLRVLGIGELGL
jgi:hypothetical protein